MHTINGRRQKIERQETAVCKEIIILLIIGVIEKQLGVTIKKAL